MSELSGVLNGSILNEVSKYLELKKYDDKVNELILKAYDDCLKIACFSYFFNCLTFSFAIAYRNMQNNLPSTEEEYYELYGDE